MNEAPNGFVGTIPHDMMLRNHTHTTVNAYVSCSRIFIKIIVHLTRRLDQKRKYRMCLSLQ